MDGFQASQNFLGQSLVVLRSRFARAVVENGFLFGVRPVDGRIVPDLADENAVLRRAEIGSDGRIHRFSDRGSTVKHGDDDAQPLQSGVEGLLDERDVAFQLLHALEGKKIFRLDGDDVVIRGRQRVIQGSVQVRRAVDENEVVLLPDVVGYLVAQRHPALGIPDVPSEQFHIGRKDIHVGVFGLVDAGIHGDRILRNQMVKRKRQIVGTER